MAWYTVPYIAAWSVGIAIFFVLENAWHLVASIMSSLLFIFTPVISVAQHIIVAIDVLIRLAASFKPLYIYFSYATFIGLVAGAILQLSSSAAVSIIAPDEFELERKDPTKGGLDSGDQNRAKHLLTSSSSEREWLWIDRDFGPMSKKLRGLQAQTILEEEDGPL